MFKNVIKIKILIMANITVKKFKKYKFISRWKLLKSKLIKMWAIKSKLRKNVNKKSRAK